MVGYCNIINIFESFFSFFELAQFAQTILSAMRLAGESRRNIYKLIDISIFIRTSIKNMFLHIKTNRKMSDLRKKNIVSVF